MRILGSQRLHAWLVSGLNLAIGICWNNLSVEQSCVNCNLKFRALCTAISDKQLRIFVSTPAFTPPLLHQSQESPNKLHHGTLQSGMVR